MVQMVLMESTVLVVVAVVPVRVVSLKGVAAHTAVPVAAVAALGAAQAQVVSLERVAGLLLVWSTNAPPTVRYSRSSLTMRSLQVTVETAATAVMVVLAVWVAMAVSAVWSPQGLGVLKMAVPAETVGSVATAVAPAAVPAETPLRSTQSV